MSRCGGQGIQLTASWVPASGGHIPPRAVSAGHNIFVMRARYHDEMLPGKLVVGHKTGYVPFDGRENMVSEYEVLCDTGLPALGPTWHWKHSNNGNVPHGALVGGHTSRREPLYVCRGHFNGEPVAGKVHPSQRCAFIPWGGQEHRLQHYEVLCFHG